MNELSAEIQITDIVGTILDPERVSAEVVAAIKGDKGDPGEGGGGLDGEFIEVFMGDASGILDLSTIESDKATWNKFMNFDFPEQTIIGFGVVPNGIKKQLWIKMEDSQEQKVLIQANPFSDTGITIVGYEYPQFLTLSGLASRDYILELSSLGEGKWVITNASSLIGQEVTIGNFILNGIVPLRFITNEVYTMASMEADATLIIDPEFPDQVPGARKTMVIEANGHDLTFGYGITVLSGIWDNRAGNSNFIEMIYTEFDGALITITSQAISPTTAIKGSTADQLSLLPIELTSAEFFELKNNSGLVPKQFYLINDFKNENNVLEGLFVFAMSVNTFSYETTSKTYPDKNVWLKTSDLFEFTRTYQEPQGILQFIYTSKNVLTLYNAMRTNFERRRGGDYNSIAISATSNDNEIILTTENEGTEWSYDIATHQITLIGALADSAFSFLDIDLVPGSSIYISFTYYLVDTRHGSVSDMQLSKIHEKDKDFYLAYGTNDQIDASEARAALNVAHTANMDSQIVEEGPDAIPVTAAELRTALDETIPSKAPINSPTFTTKITAPLIAGGTGANDYVTIQGTTGAATVGGKGLNVLVGNDGDTEAITVLNNGNTGIGVTNPARKLVVDGEAEFSGGVTTGGIVSGQSAIASGLVVNESGGNLAQDDFRVETVVNANAFVVDASANQIIVGVDLIAPKVIGGSSATADLILQTTTGVGAAGADMHFLVGNNGATEAMTILNDGKIGLAKIDPAEKLDVTGNINATGVYKVDGVQVLKEQQAAIPDMTVLFSTNPVSKSATTTIADGSTPTVNELIQYCVNLEEANKTILALLRTHGFIAT